MSMVNQPRRRMGWLLRALVPLLLVGSGAASAAQKQRVFEPAPDCPPDAYCVPSDPDPGPYPTPDPESGYSQVTLQQGTSWRLVQASGYAVDSSGQYFNEPLYMLQDTTGIYNAPLPAGVRNDLLNAVDTQSTSFVLSQSVVDQISLSEQQGSLTPALQAIAEPLDYDGEDPTQGPYPSPVEAYRQSPSDVTRMGLFGKCDDKVTNKNKSFNISQSLNRNFSLGGDFTGSLALTGDAQASATGEVQINLKRYKIFGVCIPYGVKFDHARAYGTALVNYGSTVTGTVNYATSKPWEWQLAKPELFSFAFMLGPIPVYVGFNLPITAGLSLTANVSGSVTYNGSQAISGYFDYSCTLDGCGGYSNFNTTGLQSPQVLTGSVSGQIKPTVYAQVAFRGYLYDDSVAYAQVGVRPYLYGDLWGYYGNNCGDADGDGYFETVSALTFDLDWQIYFTAQADSFLSNEKRWNLWNTPRWHINYWDLTGSSALQPMVTGAPSIPVGTTQTYGARMRPCWPYSDTVNYQLAWGDGSASTSLSGAPATAATATHAWSSTGSPSLVLTAQSDAHGRVFNRSTSRTLQVTTGGGTATHLGLTWQVTQQNGSYVHVNNYGQSNPYQGDMSPYTALPILCIKQDGRAAPSFLTVDYYNGWAAGEVRLTGPIYGSSLTSRATADALCASSAGSGFRMAEFHDGGGGWSWWAQGVISSSSRFWVAINDQPANPWN